MERVLIISYIISMILTAGFIYCIYREKYWVFEFVNRIKKPIQQLVYVFLISYHRMPIYAFRYS